jgi:hypothetical protein
MSALDNNRPLPTMGPGPKVPMTDSGTAANGIINHLVSTQQEKLGNG